MDARTERMAENEALFRAVNELIEQAATSIVIDDHIYEFVCECSDGGCTMLLAHDRLGVRAGPIGSNPVPGRLRSREPEIEAVVASRGPYLIVRKVGEPAEYVSKRDPRTL